MSGCLSALLAPVTASSYRYIAHSVVVGAATTCIFLGLFGVWGDTLIKMTGVGAFGGLLRDDLKLFPISSEEA